MENIKAKLECSVNNVLGEGPIWDSRTNCLFWVDILGNKIYRYELLTKNISSIEVQSYPSTICLSNRSSLIITALDCIIEIQIKAFDSEEMQSEIIYNKPHAFLGFNEKDGLTRRFNDGKVDANGRLWLGTMAILQEKGAGQAGLYSLDLSNEGSELKCQIDRRTISNGLCWTDDNKTFYYIDTPTLSVVKYDFDVHNGTISNKKVCIATSEADGYPDGMTIDEEGMLWVAFWQGSKIVRYDPASGSPLLTVNLPVKNVTCATFGGENLKTLYITTAKDDQGNGGDLYSIELDIKGRESYRTL